MGDQGKVIDVEKVVRNSDSPFIRSLPKFLIRLLEKVVWQDEMNETIGRFADKKGVPFIDSILNYWNVEDKYKRGGKYSS